MILRITFCNASYSIPDRSRLDRSRALVQGSGLLTNQSLPGFAARPAHCLCALQSLALMIGITLPPACRKQVTAVEREDLI